MCTYVEVLKLTSLLSLSLQGYDLDIVFGIKHVLKSAENVYKSVTLRNYSSPSMQYCIVKKKLWQI